MSGCTRKSGKEIVPAAALQGAVFGVVKAGVDRGGLKDFEQLTGVWASGLGRRLTNQPPLWS